MDIYLLRHGSSISNEKRLVCGASDYPLSANGLGQARLVCGYMNSIRFTRIYSSPLTRARQTISYLITDAEIKIVPDLVELDTGEVSHISIDELWEWDYRYRYQGLYPNLRYPSGECLNDMLKRVASWYQRAFATWEMNDIILVSGHEGTICGIMHHLLKIDIAHYPTFVIGNGDHIHISINQDGQSRYKFSPLSSLTGGVQ